MKIKSIRRIKYTGKVYNIGTPPQSNYFANGILVHNCYQDSTPQGAHADISSITTYLWGMAAAKVFEVAIGGGEPTIHPEFAKILRNVRGIPSVSFSTNSFAWYDDEEITDAVSEHVKAYAHSIRSSADIEKIAQYRSAMIKKYDHKWPNIHYQYIPDAHPISALREVLGKMSYGDVITLLGYKSTGRGGSAPYSNKDWMKVCREVHDSRRHSFRIGIDTALAQKYHHLLGDIPEEMYYLQEGRFSMYIDAVEHVYAESSFTPKDKQKPTYERLDWQKKPIINDVGDMFKTLG
jgi:hypothetical protein